MEYLSLTSYQMQISVLLAFGIPLSIQDIRRYSIHRGLLAVACGSFILVSLVDDSTRLTTSLAGLVLSLSTFFIVRRVLPRRLGMGDVLFAGGTGVLLGPLVWLIANTVACVTALMFAVLRPIADGQSDSSPIPFVPFLTGGAIVASTWALLTNGGLQ